MPLPSNTKSRFADVAHQSLSFRADIPSEKLVLDLLSSKWLQRLRHIKQTGNTNFVYMFSEHSRFGHSLGVSYLALWLMKNISQSQEKEVEPWRNAVAAAALFHDLGHAAPGSHLAEKIWSKGLSGKDKAYKHEDISIRIVKEDEFIFNTLTKLEKDLPEKVALILSADPSIPPWTHEIISGGGWNADRGNWAIVDSAMCSVSYGRYNVSALLDSLLISPQKHLIIFENRLDALTHFYLARDSMYRQVYQHRVLLAADKLSEFTMKRVRELLKNKSNPQLFQKDLFLDQTMKNVIFSELPLSEQSLDDIFKMTEFWWSYHLENWSSNSSDQILKDLATRMQHRKLFKTVRLPENSPKSSSELEQLAKETASSLGFEPNYYVGKIGSLNQESLSFETPPGVLLDNGNIKPASEVEPLIAQLSKRPKRGLSWLAVPEEVKVKMGRVR